MQYLDTRDLYKRQCELRKEKEDLEAALADAEKTVQETENEATMSRLYAATHDLQDWIEENQEELDELNSLENEVSEWTRGNTMILESEWVSYVQDLADDLGATNDPTSWIVIDWEATADGVRMDYHEVTYQGETYLVRD